MTTVRWFGGQVGSGHDDPAVPQGCRVITADQTPLWTVGQWTPAEIRTAATSERRVTVFGACGVTEHELHRLAANGVTDSVLTAFAGSYTVVESTTNSTVVFTDPGHAQPIYTATSTDGVVWGSSALALAALTGAAPDTAWLASMLLVPQRPELLAGRSAFTGVTAIPPGSRLILARGARSQIRAAWQPEPANMDMAEGATRLRAALAAAVAVRISSSQVPSADCSGGLDSTTLALLTAAQLGNGRSVHAVTVHPAGTTRGGDMDYATMAVRTRPELQHLLCPLDSRHLPYHRMVELTPATDEPAPTTVTIARAVAEFDLLRQVGSDCHLTGDGGDTLLGGHPAHLADLVRVRRFGLLCRQAVGWARLHRTPVWPLLAEARRHHHRPWPQELPSWSTPLARQLLVQTTTTAVPAQAPVEVGTLKTVTAIQTVGRTARSDIQVAEHYGLRVHNPFTDPQVISAAVAVPTWLRGSPYRYKPLLTTAMADLLPAPIATRRTKGDFTPDHYLGLRANADQLRDLADGHLAERGLVDSDRLRRLLDQAALGLPVTFSAFEPVLAAEIWLRAIESTPAAARWQPNTVTGRTAS